MRSRSALSSCSALGTPGPSEGAGEELGVQLAALAGSQLAVTATASSVGNFFITLKPHQIL